jgi:hypothetical protein
VSRSSGWRWGARRPGRRRIDAPRFEREALPVRILRTVERSQRLLRLVVQTLQSRRQSGPDPISTPDSYQRLVGSLAFFDRPLPLTRFERPFPGEARAINRMVEIAASGVVSSYCTMQNANLCVKAMRGQHAKAHGCVKATFAVRDDLPSEFVTPLFRPGARYPAIVRFSNGLPIPHNDSKLDARGMALKLKDIPAPTVLETLSGGLAPPGEHDFLLSSFPVFFCQNVIDYLQFMEAVSAPTDTWRAVLRRGRKWVAFGIRYPKQLLTFFLTPLRRIRDPLSATYHSMSPYLFADKVVRYMITPAESSRTAPRRDAGSDRSENFLRDALVADLDPGTHGPEHKVAFDFAVRVRDAATPDDAEDASRWWNRPLDKNVKLARIEIPVQIVLSADQLYNCENMAFNPWNCLPEHRPLGSVNRMRLAVYLASLQVRRRLNMLGSISIAW